MLIQAAAADTGTVVETSCFFCSTVHKKLNVVKQATWCGAVQAGKSGSVIAVTYLYL